MRPAIGHAHASAAPQLTIARPVPGVLQLRLAGTWRVGESIPAPTLVAEAIELERPDCIQFDAKDIVAWDSALVAFTARVLATAHGSGVTVDRGGAPPGVQRLLALVEATPYEAKPQKPPPSLLARIGLRVVDYQKTVMQGVAWIGELTVASGQLLRGRAKFRRSDLWLQIQATGAAAVGIVSLVAGLVGLIIAFISAVQLKSFGATLYVANLVGIAMVRELGAVMAGIVVAGRTGAAFAAELGTMRVTQEIEALTTLGLSPVEFLVLPRLIAVTLMMPLLCVYADLVGVIGGAFVGILAMDVPPRLYIQQTVHAVDLTDLFGGMIKATTYGFLIGAAGCFMGLRSGRTAADVGKAATSAVVAGIVLVIVACGLYAIVVYRLGL